ncbi:MAG: PIN domain-containing protein [Solirubrobacteraceae bacterium]
MIVLDTNVVSELMRPAPSVRVLAWVKRQIQRDLYTTAITLAEIRYGIERLPDGSRKRTLAATADQVFGDFADQLLAFERSAALRYATIVTARDRAGRPIDGFDAQIASICLEHEAALTTRNVADFELTGVQLIDPWRAADA